MTFQIATGQDAPEIFVKSAIIDASMEVCFSDWTRADRTKRQIIANIEAHEDVADLDNYIAAGDLMTDALYLFDPDMAEEIKEAHEMHRA